MQELQAPDIGHLIPPAGTANFGVTAAAAIHEPVADTASETARRLTGSGMFASPPADDAIAADCEPLDASLHQSSDGDSDVGVEGVAAAAPAAVLLPGAQLATTANSTQQPTAAAADREPQRPMVRGMHGKLQLSDDHRPCHHDCMQASVGCTRMSAAMMG